MAAIEIRPLADSDRAWVAEVLVEHWGATRVVSRGKLYQADTLPGLVAWLDGERVGLLNYHIEGEECEAVTVLSLTSGIGVGSALMDAIKQLATNEGCSRLWLITTNDNLPALRFYQKWGMTIAALYPNALAESRRLKPEIPLIGIEGIPIRDEIELELSLSSGQ